MKVFKLLSMALIAISIITSFTACNNDEEPVVPPIEEEYIDVPLKLSIDASIDITDEPISRAGNQNPVYAIEVQEINPNTFDAPVITPPITNITIVTPNPKIGRSNNSLRYSHKPSKKAFIV